MRAYTAILSARFRALLQYRMAAAAGAGTQVFWGLIRTMIFTAFYENTGASATLDLAQTISYVWLGQAFIRLMIINVDPEVAQQIRSGNVAYEMLRPVDLHTFWLSRSIAQSAAPTLLRCLPILLLATVIGWLHWPEPGALASWAAAMCGALLLGASIATVMTISLLWTVSGQGVTRLLSACGYFFSGMVVPLPLFPDWVQPVLRILPFAGMGDGPFRLFTGHMPPGAVWAVLAHQLIWSAVFILLGRLLLRRAVRRLVVQGG